MAVGMLSDTGQFVGAEPPSTTADRPPLVLVPPVPVAASPPLGDRSAENAPLMLCARFRARTSPPLFTASARAASLDDTWAEQKQVQSCDDSMGPQQVQKETC